MKVGNRIENIFAHAVAMDNRGLKNTIHCAGPNIFIVNFDHSMILRFSLRQNEVEFDTPVSFNANDYDSNEFEVVKDRIIFQTSEEGYERKKICSLAGYDVRDIKKIYHRYIKTGKDPEFFFYISSALCNLLEEQLSHLEISVEESQLIIRQRNIYSGTVIEISPKKEPMVKTMKLPETFHPVGLKTKDFTSLFSFHESLMFVPAGDFIIVKDHVKKDFDGILSFCKYDEIINLYEEEEDNGRQKQKIRRS